jgi:hypothetical protein
MQKIFWYLFMEFDDVAVRIILAELRCNAH